MAVSYDPRSSLLPREHKHLQAGILATRAYEEFGSALIGYLRANLRCADDAKDLAQDVYLRIVRHEDVGKIRSLKSYVFTIAKNLLRDKSRRCATKLAENCVHEDDVTLSAQNGDPLQMIEAEECVRNVSRILGELRPACREAYLLSRTFELSYAEIARHMGISVSMVEKHISAALKALRSGWELH